MELNYIKPLERLDRQDSERYVIFLHKEYAILYRVCQQKPDAR